MALQIHFHPDQATTPAERNQALADLMTLGGHCHRLDVRSAKRFESPPTQGWEIVYDDGNPPVAPF